MAAPRRIVEAKTSRNITERDVFPANTTMIATVEIVMAIAMVVTVPLTNCTPNQILYPRGCSLPNRVYGSKILKKIPRIYWNFFPIFRIFLDLLSDILDFFVFLILGI